jgi:hypothetical protein
VVRNHLELGHFIYLSCPSKLIIKTPTTIKNSPTIVGTFGI